MKNLSIKSKLLVLVFLVIISIAIAVSISFRMLLQDVFLKDAQTKMENGVTHLAHYIRSTRQTLVGNSQILIHNLNISNELANIYKATNYCTNSTREHIAIKLLTQLKHSSLDQIYVSNSEDKLIAFARLSDGKYICGYKCDTDFGKREPTIYIKRENSDSFTEESFKLLIPKYIHIKKDKLSRLSTTTYYRVFEDKINVLSHKSFIHNKDKVGSISMVKMIDRKHIKMISKKIHVDMNYLINTNDIDQFNEEYGVDIEHDNIFIPPLLSDIRGNLTLIERENIFISLATVQTDGKPIYVINKIKKDLLDETVLKSQKSFFFIVFVSIILFMLITIYIIEKIIGYPLREIFHNIQLIEQGNYNIKKYRYGDDEIGSISRVIYSMAETISTREKILDEKIEEEVEKNREKDKKMFQQSRLAQMGEMISMIAHQWRQPLAAIAASSVDLQVKIQLESYEEVNKKTLEDTNIYNMKRLKKIDKYVSSLSATIDDFRNFYKPDKKPKTLKLSEIILKSFSIVRQSLLNDDIKIIEEYASEESIEVYDGELMQVILNILKNSQDVFKERDTQNPYIKISSTTKSIKICDNGGGVREDVMEKIFDPYFSTKDEKNGTGLGMSMSKTIVEQHHKGKLYARNTDDGVCFFIEL